MRMSRVSLVRTPVRAAFGFFVAAGVFVSVAKPSLPAFAQPATTQATIVQLTADQITTINSAVQNALADLNPNLAGNDRQQALAQALTQVAQTEVNLDGTAAVYAVISAAVRDGVPAPQVVEPVLPLALQFGIPAATAVAQITLAAVSAGASPSTTAEAVIAVAAQNSIAGATVGTGLGQAAAALSSTDRAASAQIAIVVSNQGTSGTGRTFGTSVLANGGSIQLAVTGQQNPNATNNTGSIQNTGNNAGNTTNNTGNNANININNNNGNSNNGSSNNGNAGTNSSPISVAGSGPSQQISAVGTTITCTTPSCS
jgi:hypothetical protein